MVDHAAGIDDARACVGNRLDELAGTTVGRVEGVLADAVDGSPTWLVVRLGRIGRRAVVPFAYVAAAAGHAWAPYPRRTIRAASRVDPLSGLSSGDERELAADYGVPEGSGRLASLAGRSDQDPGSVRV